MEILGILKDASILQIAIGAIVLGVLKQKFGIDVLGYIFNGKKNANGHSKGDQNSLDSILSEVKLLQSNHTTHIQDAVDKLAERFDSFNERMIEHNQREMGQFEALNKTLDAVNKTLQDLPDRIGEKCN